jgi:CheY-like chemotaxis protein
LVSLRNMVYPITISRRDGRSVRREELEIEYGQGAVMNSDEKSAGNRATVLVIDDEPMVRMLIKDVLEEVGYEVVDVADGPTGLTILQSDSRIDLLVTDMGLPGGMNGRQVAEAGREARPDLKVLFVTGYAQTSMHGGDVSESSTQVIGKPFNFEALQNKVREMIGA